MGTAAKAQAVALDAHTYQEAARDGFEHLLLLSARHAATEQNDGVGARGLLS